MTPEEIKNKLEALEPLRQALRQRAMIYQIDAKEAQAIKDGLPIDSYYYLKYEDWKWISS